MEKRNLYEKIQAVSEQVMSLSKDMTVGKGNYTYQAISDTSVTLRVKRAEIENRILSIPVKQEIVDSKILKQVKGDKESNLFVDTVKLTLRIIDLDNTAEFIEVEAFGKGIDNADKGLGKAATYARKYALLNAYKIATGEDPDADKSPKIETETIDEKKTQVVNICMQDENTKNNILSHFNLGSLDDFSTEQITIVYNQFKAKGKI